MAHLEADTVVTVKFVGRYGSFRTQPSKRFHARKDLYARGLNRLN